MGEINAQGKPVETEESKQDSPEVIELVKTVELPLFAMMVNLLRPMIEAGLVEVIPNKMYLREKERRVLVLRPRAKTAMGIVAKTGANLKIESEGGVLEFGPFPATPGDGVEVEEGLSFGFPGKPIVGDN